MDKDSFKERERAQEEGYFRAQDAKLIEKLREDARLEEIVLALAEQLQVDNPELLRRVIALGVTLDTGAGVPPRTPGSGRLGRRERHRSGARHRPAPRGGPRRRGRLAGSRSAPQVAPGAPVG